MASGSSELTALLERVEAGEERAADLLSVALYPELHEMARRALGSRGKDHTLRPTALVHETYLRLVDQTRTEWQGRTHFLAIGARVMRRVLVDHARRAGRDKRGGGHERIALDDAIALSPERSEDVLAVDEALHKLETVDERQARVVEMRFFSGMSVQEVADALGVSKRTIEGDWTLACAWLRRELDAPAG